MKRSMIVSSLLACWLVAVEASAVVITSNDFNAFQAAVQNAAPGTTFTFNLGANSTITFSSQVIVPNNITFVGSNAVAFDGGGTSSLFFIPTTSSDSFSGFTFQNASGSPGVSGAIQCQGQVAVANSTFSHNHSTNTGGAISGNSNVSNCIFEFNDASNAGGAISSGGSLGMLLVNNCSFISNQAGNAGGAITGNAQITNSLFANNSAGNSGGAIAAGNNPQTLLVENSTLAFNHAMNAGGRN